MFRRESRGLVGTIPTDLHPTTTSRQEGTLTNAPSSHRPPHAGSSRGEPWTLVSLRGWMPLGVESKRGMQVALRSFDVVSRPRAFCLYHNAASLCTHDSCQHGAGPCQELCGKCTFTSCTHVLESLVQWPQPT